MNPGYKIHEPFQFNPLKHHLSFMREFIDLRLPEHHLADRSDLVKDIKHIGTSVMDVYTGSLSLNEIIDQTEYFLNTNDLADENRFSGWTGKDFDDFRLMTLSDSSLWILKYRNSRERYVHLFPARMSPHSFRVKANTLKSAIIFMILIGKDYISVAELNRARYFLGLSPVKETSDVEAITEMIEILRNL
jgi:hypothetical protein